MDAMAVPLPGKLVKPGESWKANRAVPIDTMEAFQSGAMEVTYTYRGTRTCIGPQGSRDRHGRGELRGGRTRKVTRQRHHDRAGHLQRSHPQGDRGGPDQLTASVDIQLDEVTLKASGTMEVALENLGPTTAPPLPAGPQIAVNPQFPHSTRPRAPRVTRPALPGARTTIPREPANPQVGRERHFPGTAAPRHAAASAGHAASIARHAAAVAGSEPQSPTSSRNCQACSPGVRRDVCSRSRRAPTSSSWTVARLASAGLAAPALARECGQQCATIWTRSR